MTSQKPSNPIISVNVPIALVALSLCVFFFGQIKGIGIATETGTETETEAENLNWRSSIADKQIATLTENHDRLAKAIEERKAYVTECEAVQKSFTDLMRDLHALAREGDKDAKAIIGPGGLKVNDPASASDEKPKEK